ncbi:Peptidoglycan/xylan/chitin deacetylase, PgdA/CDA1 family [Evansella caseinilytica]|uniref:Peptidoglycan/xylan/chitin deacetylase, PgdA/CDA1 family n=1 Tax=Evansella caseinilytica TaxID=1503961 RepID=A0A1H3RXL1_9BACI|nr:polysaccharide deacetylase family protein [Evansella caseinilytica]SDZ30058.1 Peptidoglycan/xylan/chitin deacetylase, PgdA/CDA1 family [Evansella caseinilytica]
MNYFRRGLIVGVFFIALFIGLIFSLPEKSTDSTEQISRQESKTAGEHELLHRSQRFLAVDLLRDEIADVDVVLERWQNTDLEAQQWGEHVDGVKNRLNTEEKVVALTFDACGGPNGNGYDGELIDFLTEERIPATLFINARWIQNNQERFLALSRNELFTIANHGTDHIPLSMTGSTAWGITGTNNAEEVIAEVIVNQDLIFSLTGEYPTYFRSGTAFYDEIAVKIVEDLGLTVVNFDILGDAGATFTSSQVRDALLSAEPGSIALLHMNQPTSGTAEGVKNAIPLLREQGFTFVSLDDYPLTE